MSSRAIKEPTVKQKEEQERWRAAIRRHNEIDPIWPSAKNSKALQDVRRLHFVFYLCLRTIQFLNWYERERLYLRQRASARYQCVLNVLLVHSFYTGMLPIGITHWLLYRKKFWVYNVSDLSVFGMHIKEISQRKTFVIKDNSGKRLFSHQVNFIDGSFNRELGMDGGFDRTKNKSYVNEKSLPYVAAAIIAFASTTAMNWFWLIDVWEGELFSMRGSEETLNEMNQFMDGFMRPIVVDELKSLITDPFDWEIVVKYVSAGFHSLHLHDGPEAYERLKVRLVDLLRIYAGMHETWHAFDSARISIERAKNGSLQESSVYAGQFAYSKCPLERTFFAILLMGALVQDPLEVHSQGSRVIVKVIEQDPEPLKSSESVLSWDQVCPRVVEALSNFGQTRKLLQVFLNSKAFYPWARIAPGSIIYTHELAHSEVLEAA